MSSKPNPTIAFFGATGGCMNSALVNALRGGHHVIALARTPSKLTTQLTSQNVSLSVMESQLTIIEGNALSVSDVKKTLTANNTPGYLVKHIATGLGGSPSLTFRWREPLNFIDLDQPNICAESASTLISALEEIYQETPSLKSSSTTDDHPKPHLTFVSTTGISRGPEDVPFGMRYLYHTMLATPHIDKRKMEETYRRQIDLLTQTQSDPTTSSSSSSSSSKDALFSSVIGIRPTLLTGTGSTIGSESIGLDKIRAGTEQQPETGFSVSRADVGLWIYENALNGLDGRKRWENHMVTLTK